MEIRVGILTVLKNTLVSSKHYVFHFYHMIAQCLNLFKKITNKLLSD